jgi:hypothetical protein
MFPDPGLGCKVTQLCEMQSGSKCKSVFGAGCDTNYERNNAGKWNEGKN